MSKSSSNSVKNSDECLVESHPAKPPPHKHILRRHFSADVLGVGASGPGSKFPGNGPRNRLQKTGSRIFRELSPGHLLVSRMSDGNLFKNLDKDKDKVITWFPVSLSDGKRQCRLNYLFFCRNAEENISVKFFDTILLL